jgi:hypothetical protein
VSGTCTCVCVCMCILSPAGLSQKLVFMPLLSTIYGSRSLILVYNVSKSSYYYNDTGSV